MPEGANPYTSPSAVALLFGSLSLLGAVAAPEVVLKTRLALFFIGAILFGLGLQLARFDWR